jgi:hypothetical protein
MASQKEPSVQHTQITSANASQTDQKSFESDVEQQSTHGFHDTTAAEKTAPNDPNVVNWDVDDPENPLNWPSSRKIGVVAVVAFITMLS